MTHFSNKAWIVTFEKPAGGFGCRSYGIMGIFNKPTLATNKLNQLNEQKRDAQKRGDEREKWTEYLIQEVELNSVTKLFSFNY